MRKNVKKICMKAGCPNVTTDGYCDTHTHIQKETKAITRKARPLYVNKNKKFYDSKEWKKVRKLALLRDHGFCQDCLAKGIYEAARHVDHVIELEDDPSLALVLENLQSLCIPCHSRKTIRVRQAKEKKQ